MRVAITGGGGGVGSSLAFNLLRNEEFHEVLLLDSRENMLTSHLMDLEQVLEQGADGRVRAAAAEELAEADVIVAAGAAPLTVNDSRMVYLGDNAAVLGELAASLPTGWPGILIVVTNPVDPLCTWLLERTGLPRERLLGYTLNDSLRLRSGIAAELGVAPGEVDAWVIGEHGDGSVPLFERVAVDGAPVQLDAEQRRRAEAFLRGWYQRHVALDSGRSSTWTSGLGLARMVAAIGADGGELWPASVALRGEYGVDGVCLGVPVELGRDGARRIVEWDLTEAEAAAMKAAAAAVRAATASLSETS